MECPLCGGQVYSGCCLDCDWVNENIQFELGELENGSLVVDQCQRRYCVRYKDKKSTFCPYLIDMRVHPNGYIVTCDPIFKGVKEQ